MKNKKFDDALLHVGVNDLLNDESQDSVQNLLDNLKQIGLKCKAAGVKKVLVSGIVVNNKLTSAYISNVNQRISNMCRDNSFVFIDNISISTSSLFRDGLHLLEVRKRILANNFIENLNNFFTNKTDAPTSTLISENPSINSCNGNIESEDKSCNESLKELRQKNLNRPIKAQLNINSIRNKFKFLEKDIFANLDILLKSETKLDDSFPSAQSLLDGFSKTYRLDRCSNVGGILLYIRDDIPSRLLSNSNKTESVFTEINFRKKKWLICASYKPRESNISNHLHHLSKGLDNYIGNYDNILPLGDFNSEFSEPCLNDFCDIYNLKNLVKDPTCYKNPDNPSCIDLFRTNRPRTFQCTTTIETGISDFQKWVVTALKTFYKKQRPKIIHYRNYKNFDNGNFRRDLKKELLKFDVTNAPLSKFNHTVLSVLDKYAPKKKKRNIYVQIIAIL